MGILDSVLGSVLGGGNRAPGQPIGSGMSPMMKALMLALAAKAYHDYRNRGAERAGRCRQVLALIPRWAEAAVSVVSWAASVAAALPAVCSPVSRRRARWPCRSVPAKGIRRPGEFVGRDRAKSTDRSRSARPGGWIGHDRSAVASIPDAAQSTAVGAFERAAGRDRPYDAERPNAG
jgi:hypothetical protein